MHKFLTAEWRSLLMINYEISPSILHPFVPPGVQLDLYHGKALVTLVGFLFLHTKVLDLSIPFHRNFEEVNLRFYVGRSTPEGWRHGVAFIKEIVPRSAIAMTARLLYQENYVSLTMNHQTTENAVEYSWKFQGRWNRMRAKRNGEPQYPTPGSEEEFTAEHYWGYSPSAKEYKVEHAPWRISMVSDVDLDCDVSGLYGRQFVEALTGTFSSAFLAEGSPVTVYSG